MNLKDKRNSERLQNKNRRRTEIINAAKYVFDKNGVENIKMTDIAEKAEVGVASVYRYFKTKPDLVIAVGLDYCDEILEKFDKISLNDATTGLERIEKILDLLLDIYYSSPQFIRYLQSFDFFFKIADNRTANLEIIENKLARFYPLVFKSIEIGVKDGSIKDNIDCFDMGVAVIRTFITMEQRILTRDRIIKIDEQINPDTQLKILKDMIINYLKK